MNAVLRRLKNFVPILPFEWAVSAFFFKRSCHCERNAVERSNLPSFSRLFFIFHRNLKFTCLFKTNYLLIASIPRNDIGRLLNALCSFAMTASFLDKN